MAIYMKYDGIKGNVTADGYKDQISIMSCNFGVSRGISMTPGAMTNREATRPSLSEISLTKEADCSLINLFKESVSGEAGKKVSISFVRTGADKVIEYLTYELKDVLVSSYSMSTSGDETPLENITLSFSEFVVKYSDTDAGMAGGSQKVAGYNLADAKVI